MSLLDTRGHVDGRGEPEPYRTRRRSRPCGARGLTAIGPSTSPTGGRRLRTVRPSTVTSSVCFGTAWMITSRPAWCRRAGQGRCRGRPRAELPGPVTSGELTPPSTSGLPPKAPAGGIRRSSPVARTTARNAHQVKASAAPTDPQVRDFADLVVRLWRCRCHSHHRSTKCGTAVEDEHSASTTDQFRTRRPSRHMTTRRGLGCPLADSVCISVPLCADSAVVPRARPARGTTILAAGPRTEREADFSPGQQRLHGRDGGGAVGRGEPDPLALLEVERTRVGTRGDHRDLLALLAAGDEAHLEADPGEPEDVGRRAAGADPGFSEISTSCGRRRTSPSWVTSPRKSITKSLAGSS